jgi:hypothetical protein
MMRTLNFSLALSARQLRPRAVSVVSFVNQRIYSTAVPLVYISLSSREFITLASVSIWSVLLMLDSMSAVASVAG